MFRKLVSNLPYSPALITEVGFYARRLRGEEVTRRMTVLFVIFALVIQSLAVFSPPESANASSEQDLIRGGVSDLNDFLARYDHNEDDIKDIYSAAGVTRSEIAATHTGTIATKDNTYAMSRYGQLTAEQGEVSMPYQRSSGGTGIRYFSPLASTSGNRESFKGWIGQSASLGWFGIIQASGSLATHGLPTSIDPAYASVARATKSVSSTNLTQGSAQSSTVNAEPLDKISYSLKVSNASSISLNAPLSVRIGDILEYSSLIDGGGGNFDATTNTLSWPQVQLSPGQSQERTFVVQLLSIPPSTPTGKSNPASYDCQMTLVFGNSIDTSVDCPPAKGIESLFLQLPNGSTGLNIGFALVLICTVSFFYLRTRQLKQEIRIIRHNVNTGII
ncbi:MAG: exported protein of unknown function [Candidatus Saccharibacteria bacterium]|nr:exported protein of unknown function [Candidatus Saccharibacteria bacterium]